MSEAFSKTTKLLVIFPCYNEEEILPNSIEKFFPYFENLISEGLISAESRICFVDDGSKDATWNIISNLENRYINALKLSSNFGHQKALLAGLESFKDQFDAYVTLDVDLQDDHTVITKMLQQMVGGSDIVYGVRADRSSDSFFKRTSASGFYKFMSFLGVKTIFNHADFRMINNKALKSFLQYPESHLFIRAIFPTIGLTHSLVYYDRIKRDAGESKYSIKKMVSLAWDGITSFSVRPLRYILIVGLLSTLISIILLLWATIELLRDNVVHGWFSMIALIMFFGGIQTFALGIIGEYVGKIFLQVKNRPRYLVEEKIEK